MTRASFDHCNPFTKPVPGTCDVHNVVLHLFPGAGRVSFWDGNWSPPQSLSKHGLRLRTQQLDMAGCRALPNPKSHLMMSAPASVTTRVSKATA
jgi:hypothetical protein